MKKQFSIIKAAKAGGKVLIQHFNQNLEIRAKSTLADLQTNADLASEKVILEILKKEFPKYNIWSEEAGLIDKKSEYSFVIDPLDGTLNFIYGIPYFSVAIALMKKKETLFSIIYDPVFKKTYWAEKGKGAYLNDKKIKVNQETNIKKCSIVYITGYKNSKNYFPKLVKKLDNYKVKRILTNWSVALDFCLFASGKIEAIIHVNSELYDHIAGKLIAEEAGALITDFKGKKEFEGRKFLVSNGTKIHEQILKIV
jgi:myo-inositol-1(or 4)-monophosphatase